MLSQRQFNLRGRQMEVVSSPGGPMRFITKEVVRRKDGRSLARCIAPGDQRGQVKVDDGEWIRSFDPRRRIIETTRSLPRINSESDARRMIRRIRANYSVQLRNPDWIAGRQCDVVEMVPYDTNGHSVKIWIDRQTGATLSRQENGRRNETLGLTFFTNVTLPRKVADAEVAYQFPSRSRAEKLSLSRIFRDITPLRKLAHFELHLPVSMPGGFEFESCELALLNGAPVACLRFTDGVAIITICQSWLAEPMPNGSRQTVWKQLPRGEVMVLSAFRQTSFIVVGPREPPGIIPIARALDNDRERVLINQLSRETNIPIPTIQRLRDLGMGLDHLAALSEIAARTGRRFESLVAMHRDGWSCGSIAKQLSLDPQHVADRVREYQYR